MMGSPRMERRCVSRIRNGNVSQYQITVSGESFCIRRNDVIRAETQWLLQITCGCRVVDGYERPCLPGNRRQLANVADVESRVGWGFQPQQASASDQVALSAALGRCCSHLDAKFLEPVGRE